MTGLYLDLCRKCNQEAKEDLAEAYDDVDAPEDGDELEVDDEF